MRFFTLREVTEFDLFHVSADGKLRLIGFVPATTSKQAIAVAKQQGYSNPIVAPVFRRHNPVTYWDYMQELRQKSDTAALLSARDLALEQKQ